jgi:hypothetical protein
MSTKPPLAVKAPLARYANYFEVGHNAYEFLLDFGQFQPESERITLHTRMALGPPHAKLLSRLLADAVREFELRNGLIAELGAAGEREGLSAVLRALPDYARRAAAASQRALAASDPDPPPKR